MFRKVVPPNRYEFSSKGNPMECDGLLMCAPYIFDWWNIYNAKAVRFKEYSPLMFEVYINDRYSFTNEISNTSRRTTLGVF